MRIPIGYASTLALATLVLSAPSRADAPSPAVQLGALSILFENDVFYNTDRDYTNGVEFSYTAAAADTPELLSRIAHSLPYFSPSGTVRATYSLGQNIYTPSDLQLADPPMTERPYAGFLYGGLGLADDTGSLLDQIELQLGVTGPSSLAQNTQTFVHAIIHDQKPMGWKTQLRGEPGVILTYERNIKLIPPQSVLGLFFDAEPHYGGAVGNVYDYANVGGMARIGFNLPEDYGPMHIEPSLPGSNYFTPTGEIGAYLFVGVDGRAIARNLFLDGNTWEPSRSVDKKNLVGDFEFGAALTFNFARLTFTHVIRTREYETQATPDQFGAINLTFGL